MLLVAIFGMLWQYTGEVRYEEPFRRSVEAVYAGSDIKTYAEAATDRVRKKFPVLTTVGPAAYAIGIRRQFQWTSGKATLIPNTVTSFRYDHRANNGAVTVTWRF